MKKCFFALMTFCAVVAAAQFCHAAPTEAEKEAALEALTRLMAVYKTDADGNIIFFDLTDQICTNDDLAKICKLDTVTQCKIYGANLKPGGAGVIKGLTACTKLSIENTDFEDADMAVLTEMPWVEELTLRRNTYLGKETLSYVAKMPKLRNLVLLYGNFDDAAVQELKDVKTLRLLDLRGCASISDRGMAIVKGLPNLIVLKIRCTAVTNAGVENIRGKKMRTFHIEDSQTFDDSAMDILAEMAGSLTELTIMRCIAISDEGVLKLGSLAKMQKLNLRGNYIGGEALEAVKNMADLELLVISETFVDDAGLKFLEGLTKLKTLDLWQTDITDAGMDSLAKITSLTNLSIMNNKITDAGVKKLTPLVNLTHLNLNETGITNDLIPMLSSMKGLKKLSVKATQITAEGVRTLREALPDCTVEE